MSEPAETRPKSVAPVVTHRRGRHPFVRGVLAVGALMAVVAAILSAQT